MNEATQISVGDKSVLYIIDKKAKFLFSDIVNASIIESEQELNSITFEQQNFSAIVILAELEWKDKYVQHFFGFDIAVELRRKYRLTCPIIIISTFPRYWFEKLAEKELKYNILYGRGTAFLHVDEIDEKLEKTIKSLPSLSEAVLSDLNEMLLNQKGMIIDKLTHDLRPAMSKENLFQMLSNVEAYLSNEQKVKLGLSEFKEQFVAVLGDESKFKKVKETLLLRCEQEFAGPDSTENETPEQRHKIIFLEDDTEFAATFKQKLKDYFEELLITHSSKEAIKMIDEDEDNSITGIVADWRLYQGSEKKYWQQQGYEVLEYAAQKRMMALFSLTSLADRNVHNIRNMLGLDIHLFKKSHLQGFGNTQWELMADTINQKCDEIVELIASQPTGRRWKKFREEYIQKRNSGWQNFEHGISTEAERIITYYKEANAGEETRNVYSIGEMGFSLKNDLKNTLIVRRVFLGLYFILAKSNRYLQDIIPPSLLGDGDVFETELKHHSIDVHSLLRKDWWDDRSAGVDSVHIEEEWGKLEQRVKNLRSALCIELSTLPGKGLLPEEKSWLSRQDIDYSFLFNYW